MIRRDYLMRMIEEFLQALARMRALKQEQRWDEAAGELDAEFRKLVGDGAATILGLSETELLARIVKEGPTQAVRDKTLLAVSLLAEAGDVAEGAGRGKTGREYRLKALHLLLDVLARGEVFEWAEFVPKVEVLRAALGDEPLPLRTTALLMHHYERSGELGKAEDMLYAILDAEPENKSAVGFGVSFYERLLAQPDAKLEEGGLPRVEVEEGLRELEARQ